MVVSVPELQFGYFDFIGNGKMKLEKVTHGIPELELTSSFKAIVIDLIF